MQAKRAAPSAAATQTLAPGRHSPRMAAPADEPRRRTGPGRVDPLVAGPVAVVVDAVAGLGHRLDPPGAGLDPAHAAPDARAADADARAAGGGRLQLGVGRRLVDLAVAVVVLAVAHLAARGPGRSTQTATPPWQAQRPGRHSPVDEPQLPGTLSTRAVAVVVDAVAGLLDGPHPAHALERAVRALSGRPGRQGPTPDSPGPQASPTPNPSSTVAVAVVVDQVAGQLGAGGDGARAGAAAGPARAGDHARAAQAHAAPAIAGRRPAGDGGPGQRAAGHAGGEAGQPEAVDQPVAVVVLAVAQLDAGGGGPHAHRPLGAARVGRRRR